MILADYGAEVIIVNRPQESSLPVSTQNTFM